MSAKSLARSAVKLLSNRVPVGVLHRDGANHEDADFHQDGANHQVVELRQSLGLARKGIGFEQVDHPKVSILIPAYGELELTWRCLAALSEVRSAHSFEVLVLDDASPGNQLSPFLANLKGLRFLRAEVNRGFLGNCNWGAENARGDYLLLLNNDTEPHRDFLDPLIELLDNEADIGIAGSMLIYPSGVVQEAGGIIWGDGTGWNYGRHDALTDSRNLFRREVDYCSGASILIRQSLWKEIGGFDDHFAPAYYEDVDLCFEARKRGFKTVYQPRSKVVHLEGGSYGTSDDSKKSKVINANRIKFVEKWAAELSMQFPPSTDLLMRSRHRLAKPSLAIVDHAFPAPDKDAGSLRMVEIVEAVRSQGYGIHFFPSNGKADGPLCDEWRSKGIEVFSGSHDIADILRQMGSDLVAILLSRPQIASPLMLRLRDFTPKVPIIYDMVDAHGLRELRRAALQDDFGMRRAAESYHQFELALCESSDAVVVVSEDEGLLMQPSKQGSPTTTANDKYFVIPTIYRAGQKTVPAERRGVLFVGGYAHPPNIDAANYLARDILPFLPPGHDITLAGSNVTKEVKALESSRVTVPGYLPDLTELYRSTRVAVAPLRYGAGVKGKVCEALAMGVPIVTTTVGAEGLGLVDGETALIRDSAASIAEAIARLCEDDQLWQELSEAGQAHIRASFGPERVDAVVTDLFGYLSRKRS
jgi:O-antigen biosynthesis protein